MPRGVYNRKARKYKTKVEKPTADSPPTPEIKETLENVFGGDMFSDYKSAETLANARANLSVLAQLKATISMTSEVNNEIDNQIAFNLAMMKELTQRVFSWTIRTPTKEVVQEDNPQVS